MRPTDSRALRCNVCDTSTMLFCLLIHVSSSSAGHLPAAVENRSILCNSCYGRVSTTPGNPGNLLEFKNPPGTLLEFVWSSWKFLCKMSMIDCIGFKSWWNWVPDSLFKQLVALFIFAMAPCCVYHFFVLYLGKLVDSVHCTAGRSNAYMSCIFLEILPGISWKSPGNLFS